MQPLAERMRPQSLDEYIGQQHLIGKGAVLERAIRQQRLPSFLLWGPPGVGKTTLAKVISHSLELPFFTLSAINSGVKDVRDAIDKAQRQQFFDRPAPILFIDEIHRFSKSQQDSLLGAVEAGIVTLIGATTENPSFEVIPALLSRCQVYVLQELGKEELLQMVHNAMEKDPYLNRKKMVWQEYDALLQLSGGDGRKLYNIMELIAHEAYETGEPLLITNDWVRSRVQENLTRFDKGGEQHYDIASAFIKSIRGSDPNGAIYWLARMVEGGEDIKFIARRMVIAAAEDIGMANPNALLMAQTAFNAVQVIGWPEGRIILAQAAVYLACSPKSNASYLAINAAQAAVQRTGTQPVPLHLRNAPTRLMKDLDYGKNYQYSHDFDGHFSEQEFLPEALSGQIFYDPQDNPAEKATRERLRAWWKKKYGY